MSAREETEAFWAAVNAPTYDEAREKVRAYAAEVRAAALREAADHRQRYENQMVAAAELIGVLRKTEAALARVRSVLDEWYGTSDASALSAELRAALKGQSSE